MFYLYILYSKASNLYYVGISHEPYSRLEAHNTSDRDTYTSKHRPWVLATLFQCGSTEAEALRIERFIKKQKSRKLIEQLIDPLFIPGGILAQLVRVPDVRD